MVQTGGRSGGDIDRHPGDAACHIGDQEYGRVRYIAHKGQSPQHRVFLHAPEDVRHGFRVAFDRLFKDPRIRRAARSYIDYADAISTYFGCQVSRKGFHGAAGRANPPVYG